MPRTSRIVAPGLPHHVTQRGNRQERIFLIAGDEQRYLDILAAQTRRHGVETWAYCLMPNHVHLILTPLDEGGLARAIGETHRRYSAVVNGRQGWTGHLFQARFASVVMDERHLMAAFRYVALNPVRAKLVERAEDWPWSSVRAHLSGSSNGVVDVAPLLARIDDFAGALEMTDREPPEFTALRVAESTGAPLGDKAFRERLRERGTGQAVPRDS